MPASKPDEPVIYNFEIYGPRSEILGAVALKDDTEAIEFAKNLIRDLIQTKGAEYTGCSLLISADHRTVGIIPFILPG